MLTQRSEFLATAGSGIKYVLPSLVVQARRRKEIETSPASIRIGFTATKKLGNAVVRNRVKRRLREAARELVPELGLPGCDYVFIGREASFMGTYDGLISDMKHALTRLAPKLK